MVDAETNDRIATYRYDPFGNLISSAGTAAGHIPLRFQTQYFDEETGLYYWKNRYYDPRLGRWLNRDPLGENGGINLNAFAGNNPLSVIDPFGFALTDFSDPEWHHRLVQKHAEIFEKLGFDIHAPQWGRYIETDMHRAMTKEYTKAWDAFFARNQGQQITQSMVTDELKKIEKRMARYLKGSEIAGVRYGSSWTTAKRLNGFIRVSSKVGRAGGRVLGKAAQIITIAVVVQAYNEGRAEGLSHWDAANRASLEVVNMTPYTVSELAEKYRDNSNWESILEQSFEANGMGGNLFNGFEEAIPGSRAAGFRQLYEMNHGETWESQCTQ